MTEQSSANPFRLHRKPPAVRISVCLECGTPVPTELVEVTRVDLMFLTDRPLRFGTPLQLVMFGELVTTSEYSTAHVHYCRPTHRGWQIGVFLNKTVPDRLTQNSWDEMRTELRYDCDWKAWILWQSNGELDPVRLQCYSISGMRMQLNRRVETGSQFTVFGSASQRSQSVLGGRVEWCREVEGTFVAGCYFASRRGRELPRLFGNLTDIHAKNDAKTRSLSGANSADQLNSLFAEPEQFLAGNASSQTDLSLRNFRTPSSRLVPTSKPNQ